MSSKWDEYFYDICRQVGKNTKCMSRQIGAILVKDKSIISTGYNGPPRGVPHCNERYKYDELFYKKLIDKTNGEYIEEHFNRDQCPRQLMKFRSGEGLDYCIAAHAERNCLINAARNGICTKDTTMYMDCGIPCGDCLIEIINSGVKEIVCTKLSYYDYKSEYLQKMSDIKIRTFKHLKETGELY